MSAGLYINLDDGVAQEMAAHPEITAPGTKAILRAIFGHHAATQHIEFGGVITTPDGPCMACLVCGKQLPIVSTR